MDHKTQLAYIVAFYLSKYDKQALQNLGYGSWKQVYQDVELRLGMKANSVKNRRDDFDKFYGHRAGWHQEPLTPTQQAIIQAFDGLEESTIRTIVQDILNSEEFVDSLESHALISVMAPASDKHKHPAGFVMRGPTGRKAEELFVEAFEAQQTPFHGTLIDCRDEGVGFDFKVVSPHGEQFVEIKGLAAKSGGARLTEKEWSVAIQKGSSYFLVVISDVEGTPEFTYIQDPATALTPSRHVAKTITVSWDVPASQIFKKA